MPTYLFPPFEPHRLLRWGHAQTLAGVYWPSPQHAYTARRHRVTLADGDQIVLHDDRPVGWRAGDRSALLMHGLGGNHLSGYMVRIAQKLVARGIRVFRMDLRGCGAGMALARLPYHSGRSEDAAAALLAIARLAPRSPTTLVGFSLSGNIVLKLLGELGSTACGNLDSAMVVCPPIDLAAASRRISQPVNRPYDLYFVNVLLAQLGERRRVLPQAARGRFSGRPNTLWQFDDEFTAVVSGFGTAERYYREASSAQFVGDIRLPVLVVASRDDPLVPSTPLERLALPSSVEVRLTETGGHLGFIGRVGVDPDRRWLDWRVVDWISSRDGTTTTREMACAASIGGPALHQEMLGPG